ncbi:MAG: Lrp/AsnC family transcriptional regulator [Candidatus Omnitrophica bacterium]|nr:Lrp/AsnC family transcriptional regulator [Candidatus Omnitrophota bacterium]
MKPDKKFILALNRPLGIIKMPFSVPAKSLGWDENKFLKVIRSYKNNGVIRRLGLILAHREVGLKSNVLVAWKVAEKSLERAANTFQKAGEVSHCYQRKTHASWPYNIYTMIHGRSRQDCLRIVKRFSRMTGIKDYQELFTLKELKKTKADLWMLTK